MALMTPKLTIFLIAYAVTFLNIIISLGAGAIHGVQTGEWGVLGRTAGDTVFAADQEIYEATQPFIDPSLITVDDPGLRQVLVEGLRQKIIHGFLILSLVWILLYKLLRKISFTQDREAFNNKFIVAVLTTAIIMIVEMVYVGKILDMGFIWPLRGVWSAFQSMGSWLNFESVAFNTGINMTNITG